MIAAPRAKGTALIQGERDDSVKLERDARELMVSSQLHLEPDLLRGTDESMAKVMAQSGFLTDLFFTVNFKGSMGKRQPRTAKVGRVGINPALPKLVDQARVAHARVDHCFGLICQAGQGRAYFVAAKAQPG